MSALRALWYADWRAFVNNGRRVLRSPGRIAVWAGYALVLGVFVWSRAGGRGRAGPGLGDIARADYFVCALLATLALSLASGFGAIGIFRSRAEARFIIGSPVAAPVAIAYLQAREALAQGFRLLFSFMYFIFFFGPRRLGPLAVAADLVLVVAIISAAAAIVVPRRLASRRAGIACVLAGLPLALIALAPAVRDAAVASADVLPAPAAGRILALLPAWHPGRVLLEPNPLWLLAVAGLAALAIAVLAAAGRDAYPELYALSMARIERLERWRRRRAGAEPSANLPRRVRTAFAAPPGVLVFVWKSVIEFTRQTRPPYVAGGVVLWCVAGFVAARFVSGDQAALFATLFGVVVNVLLLVGIGASNTIAGELRRPLFWLAPAALFERLCALGLARLWRTVATLELVALGFALGGGNAFDTLVVAVGLPALAALVAGVGFAAFALFPNTADWRGPVAALRVVVAAVLLVPPFVAYIVSASVLHSAALGLSSAVTIALVEAGALVGLAAWRLDGRIDRLAT